LGIIRHEKTEKYLASVRDRLLKAIPHAAVNIPVFLTADSTLNRLSTADCGIFLSLAFIVSVDSEDEIAAVLAHELGHILLGHWNENRAFAAVSSAGGLASTALFFASGGATLSLTGLLQIMAPAMTGETVDAFGHPAWDIYQEWQADLFSAEVMRRAGYDAVGAKKSLEIFEKIEKDKELLEANNKPKVFGFSKLCQISPSHYPRTRERILAISSFDRKNHLTTPVRSDRNEIYARLKADPEFLNLVEESKLAKQIIRTPSKERSAPEYHRAMDKFIKLRNNSESQKTFSFLFARILVDDFIKKTNGNTRQKIDVYKIAYDKETPKWYQAVMLADMMNKNRYEDAAKLFDFIYGNRDISLLEYRPGILSHEALSQSESHRARLVSLVSECMKKRYAYESGHFMEWTFCSTPDADNKLKQACYGRSGPVPLKVGPFGLSFQ
jgi:predicted Zn-dependent protease